MEKPLLALTIAALAVGLGNFGASISIGLSGATAATRLKVGIVFGVFEAGMPLVGLLVGHGTARALGNVSGYAGGGLLIAIGTWQFVQALRARGQTSTVPSTTGRLLLTGLALSMDNLVVGFSLGVQHTSLVEAVVVFAVVSVGLSLLGLEFGRRLGAAVEFSVEYLVGIVLVAVGVILATGEV
jgi:putative Mn2+ efflux pump MntP